MLVIEDEPEIRRFVRQALQAEGLRVVEAELLQRGLSDAATRNADAVVAYLDEKLWALDVDDDGQYVAATDGVLILRYLLGFRGAALVDGAVSQFAGRTSTADIEAYLQSLKP